MKGKENKKRRKVNLRIVKLTIIISVVVKITSTISKKMKTMRKISNITQITQEKGRIMSLEWIQLKLSGVRIIR